MSVMRTDTPCTGYVRQTNESDVCATTTTTAENVCSLASLESVHSCTEATEICIRRAVKTKRGRSCEPGNKKQNKANRHIDLVLMFIDFGLIFIDLILILNDLVLIDR